MQDRRVANLVSWESLQVQECVDSQTTGETAAARLDPAVNRDREKASGAGSRTISWD